MPLTIEAKFLKDLPQSGFFRKINYSKMQEVWLKKCHSIQPYSVMGLVGCRYDGEYHAILCDPTVTKITDWEVHNNTGVTSVVPLVDGYFDIRRLFESSSIPRMET